MRRFSRRGAAVTIIDGRGPSALPGGLNNVALFMDGGEFGRPGKGFTVTNTLEGNSAASYPDVPGVDDARVGILTVDFPQDILIEANLVTGWSTGIVANSSNKIMRKNVVSGNATGIRARAGGLVAGNVT